MAVMQMRRVSICALKQDRAAILETLQSMGMMEIGSMIDEDEAFQKMDIRETKQSAERGVRTAELALAVLDQYLPKKASLFAGLEGKRSVGRKLFEEVAARREKLLGDAECLSELNREIAEIKGDILKMEQQMESLKPWLPLDVPMNFEGTARTALLLGVMGAGTTLEQVYERIAEGALQAEGAEVHMITADRDGVYLAVVCLKKDAGQIEEALRRGGFVKPALTAERTPRAARSELEAQKGRLNQRIAELRGQIEKKAGIREELKMLSDYFRVLRDQYEVLGTLPQSRRTFLISGYATEADIPEIERAVGGRFDCAIDAEELGEDEEAPVILENNGFSSSMEGVVESYALPRSGEFDPTAWMSFFYVFFFGMMLSDAAYGAILAGACLVVRKKFPGMNGKMARTVRMFFYCGISTLIWGVLFGGYFGNAVEVISQRFFGKAVSAPALWFAPLEDPMRLLVYSLAFGLVHLFTGLGIKGYLLVKAGRLSDFFWDVALWYALLVGLILLLVPTDMFATIAQRQIYFPPAVHLLAKVLAAGGAVGLILMSGRRQKNPALRLAMGVYDLYNITGWLSDLLSYSRLLALGLATGVIASVINQMAGMAGKSVLGAIAFAVIFVVGHTLNLAINLLGAYVHTNRLQFVEFFGKFYEGGGRAFAPFKMDTKYVTVEEGGEGEETFQRQRKQMV